MSAAAHASSLPDPEPRPAFAPVTEASDPVTGASDAVSEAPDPVTGASDPVTESFDPVTEALAALAAGRPVVVVDDADREDEGDLIVPAQLATPELVGLMVRHTSGVICVAMPGGELDRLALPPMTATNQDPKGTAYTVSVDARAGVTTGISAADRARTIHALADPATTSGDLRRPGHVFPLRAAPGGVLARRGHTEAGVDLARLAGLRPVAAIAELVTDDGATARRGQLFAFARRHRFPIISIDDLATYRRATEPLVTRAATTRLPTPYGTFTAYGYREELTGAEHLALVTGEVTGRSEVLVRVHSECLTGDVFGSRRCDCGAQLDASLRAVADEGRGVVVYLRGHEGRGVGLLAKLAAYALQDAGADTVEANVALGLPVDARDYAVAARVLADLGVASVRLLTNNPAKLAALPRYGMPVTQRVALPIRPTAENLHYLRTKRDRMGHLLPRPGQEPPTPVDRAAGLTGAAGAAGAAGVGRPGGVA